MSFVGTAIYSKNVPPAERTLRLLAAAAGGLAAMLYLADPWLRWSAVASALMFALTGLFGFCPACYMAGRKLASRQT